MLVMRQRHIVEGNYCRSCGLSLFREITNRTLLFGWWGFISFFVNWLTIVRNVGASVSLRRLAAPTPTADVRAPLPEPLDPGKPLFLRLGPLVVVALIVGVAALFAVDASRGPAPDDAVGTCVELTDDRSRIEGPTDCDGRQDAVVESVVDTDDPCPAESDLRFESDEDALCLVLS